MRSTALESLAILHHCLDGISVEGTGETLSLTLHTLQYRNTHIVLSKLSVNLQHLLSLCLSLFLGSMSGMTLLPEELRGTEEWTGTHLPTHYVAPLVAEDREITP